MNIEETLAPNSDQLDAVDLLGSERVFTIAGVSKGSAEQPVNVELAGFPRPWRPGKSMRRVLAACWSTDASTWVGRRVQLYCDPDVKFGGVAVGGIRVRALSHIDKARTIPLLVTHGKSAPYTVEPLADTAPPPDYAAQIEAATSKDELNALWRKASSAGHLTDDLKAAIIARGAEVEPEPEPTDA